MPASSKCFPVFSSHHAYIDRQFLIGRNIEFGINISVVRAYGIDGQMKIGGNFTGFLSLDIERENQAFRLGQGGNLLYEGAVGGNIRL